MPRRPLGAPSTAASRTRRPAGRHIAGGCLPPHAARRLHKWLPIRYTFSLYGRTSPFTRKLLNRGHVAELSNSEQRSSNTTRLLDGAGVVFLFINKRSIPTWRSIIPRHSLLKRPAKSQAFQYLSLILRQGLPLINKSCSRIHPPRVTQNGYLTSPGAAWLPEERKSFLQKTPK